MGIYIDDDEWAGDAAVAKAVLTAGDRVVKSLEALPLDEIKAALDEIKAALDGAALDEIKAALDGIEPALERRALERAEIKEEVGSPETLRLADSLERAAVDSARDDGAITLDELAALLAHAKRLRARARG